MNKEVNNNEQRTENRELRTNEINNEQSFEETLIKLKPYINKLLEKKKPFLIFNGIVVIVTVLILLLFVKPYFKSAVVILPEYGSQSTMLGGLSSLASIAGINVGDATPTEIYENILKSEKVISEVIYKKYFTEEFEDSVNLIEYFEIETTDKNMPLKLQERELFLTIYEHFVKNRIETDVDRITAVLSVSVTMPEPALSSEVVNALASSLDNYITNDRQSYAREQREYLSNRISEVKDTLFFYENELKVFRENNRAISNSPQLILEQNRLVRQVEITQSVYLELIKQYELIKLEEVKDTPVINVMEKAEQPVKKAGPRRSFILIVIMLFSGIVSGLYIVFGEKVRKYWNIIW